MSTDLEQEQRHRSSFRLYFLVIVVLTLPLIGLAVFTYHVSSQTTREFSEERHRAMAVLAGYIVEAEFEHWLSSLYAFSERSDLVRGAAERNEETVRQELGVLVESHPRVERAFMTDLQGNLWSDYPRAPESLGKNFSSRDWFAGVSANWEPYVSAVYRRNAYPQLLLVAIAAPVRDPGSRELVGIVVYQVRLERIVHALQAVQAGEGGYAFLLDHMGTLAAHPHLDLQERVYTEYAGIEPVKAALNGGPQRMEYSDPLSGEGMLATAVPCKVGSHEWVVVSQQPLALVRQPATVLMWQIGAAAAILALLLGAFGSGLARVHERLRRVSAELERENRQRVQAEAELRKARDGLALEVQHRTRELRSTEEQLHHAQRMEAVGRLAGGIAHDFNNLLSIIIGYGDIVLMKMPKDAPLRAEIKEIRNAGERAANLTRQLLAFSRKQVLKPEIIDLNEIMRHMEKMLRRLIGEHIDLAVRMDPDLSAIKFDPGQIEQIIVNLVVNARDAMPSGGKLTIRTANVELDENYAAEHAEARVGPHVMLAIADTGAGMDAETRAKIFEPFFTTKAAGRGTGLGLSTVYGIVKQSGGNIWVYSEPGHGTTFKVYLPAASGTRVSTARHSGVLPALKGNCTVLVAEDENSVRALNVRVLEASGYKVIHAAEPEEALRLAREYDGPIHMLLTDVVMPGMGGRQLAETLQAARPEMQVLYVSGYTDDTVVHHGVLEEGMAFLEKPIRPEALLNKVREVLEPAP